MEFKSEVSEGQWNVESAINAISSDDLALAEAGCEFLESAIRDHQNYLTIEYIRIASKQFTNDSILYMRFIKLMCKIASMGEDEFRLSEKCGAVQDIVALCTTDDILVQMNAVQLLISLAETHCGLEYMSTGDVIR